MFMMDNKKNELTKETQKRRWFKRGVRRQPERAPVWKDEYEDLELASLSDHKDSVMGELELTYEVARELRDRKMSLDELKQWYKDENKDRDDFPDKYYKSRSKRQLKRERDSRVEGWDGEWRAVMRTPRLLEKLERSGGVDEYLSEVPEDMKFIIDEKGRLDLDGLLGGKDNEYREIIKVIRGKVISEKMNSVDLGEMLVIGERVLSNRLPTESRPKDKEEFGESLERWNTLSKEQQDKLFELIGLLKEAKIDIGALKDRKLLQVRAKKKYFDIEDTSDKYLNRDDYKISEKEERKAKKWMRLADKERKDELSGDEEKEWNSKPQFQVAGKAWLELLEEAVEELDLSLEESWERFSVWQDKKNLGQRKLVFWENEKVLVPEERDQGIFLRKLINDQLQKKMALVADVFMEEWYKQKGPRREFGFVVMNFAMGMALEEMAIGDPEYKALMNALKIQRDDGYEGSNYDKWRSIAIMNSLDKWFDGYISERVKPDEIKGKMGAHMNWLGNVENLIAMYEQVPDFARAKGMQALMGYVESGTGRPIQYGDKWEESTKGLIDGWVEKGKARLASRYAIEVERGVDGVWREKQNRTSNREEFYVKRIEMGGGSYRLIERVVDRKVVRMRKDRTNPDRGEKLPEALVLEMTDVGWDHLSFTDRQRYGRSLGEGVEEEQVREAWEGLESGRRLELWLKLDDSRSLRRTVIGNNGVHRFGGFGQVTDSCKARARYEEIWMSDRMVELAIASHKVEGTGVHKSYAVDKMFRPDMKLQMLDIGGLGTIDVAWLIQAVLEEKHFMRGKEAGMEAIRFGKEIYPQLTEAGQKLFFEEVLPEVSVMQTGVMGHLMVAMGLFDPNPLNRDQIFKLDWTDRAPIYSLRVGKLNGERKRREIYRWMSYFSRLKGVRLCDEFGRWAGNPEPFNWRDKRNVDKLIGYIDQAKKGKNNPGAKILRQAWFEVDETVDKNGEKIFLFKEDIGERDIDNIFNNFFVELLDRFNDRVGFSAELDQMDFSLAREEAGKLLNEQLGLMWQNRRAREGTKEREVYQQARELLIEAGIDGGLLDKAMGDKSERGKIAIGATYFDELVTKWDKVLRLEKALEQVEFWDLSYSYIEKDGRTLGKKLMKGMKGAVSKFGANLEKWYYKLAYWYNTYGFLVGFFKDIRTKLREVSTKKFLSEVISKFMDQSDADKRGSPGVAMEQMVDDRYIEYLRHEIKEGRIASVPKLRHLLDEERVGQHHVDIYGQDEKGWARPDPVEWEKERKKHTKRIENELIWGMTIQRVQDFNRFPPGLDRILGMFEIRGPEELFTHVVLDPEAAQKGEQKFLEPDHWRFDKAKNYWMEQLVVPASNMKASTFIEKLKTVAAWGAQFKEALTQMHFSGFMATVSQRVWWGVMENWVSLPSSIIRLYNRLNKLSPKTFFEKGDDGYYQLPWYLEEWAKAYWRREGEKEPGGIDITSDTSQDGDDCRRFLFDLLYEEKEREGRKVYGFREEGFQLLILQTFLLKIGSLTGQEKRLEEMVEKGILGEVYLYDSQLDPNAGIDEQYEEKEKERPLFDWSGDYIYSERAAVDKNGRLRRDDDGNLIIEETLEKDTYIGEQMGMKRTIMVPGKDEVDEYGRDVRSGEWIEKEVQVRDASDKANQWHSEMGEQMKGGHLDENSLPVVWLRRQAAPMVYGDPDAEGAQKRFEDQYNGHVRRRKIAKLIEASGQDHLFRHETVLRVMKEKMDDDPFFSRASKGLIKNIRKTMGFLYEINDKRHDVVKEMIGYGDTREDWQKSKLGRMWLAGDPRDGVRPGDLFRVENEFQMLVMRMQNTKNFDRSNMWDLSYLVKEVYGVSVLASRGERAREYVRTWWRSGIKGKFKRDTYQQMRKVRREMPGFRDERELVVKLKRKMSVERMIQFWIVSELGVNVGKLEFTDNAGRVIDFDIENKEHRDYLRNKLELVMPKKWEDHYEKMYGKRNDFINKSVKNMKGIWVGGDIKEAWRVWREELAPFRRKEDREVREALEMRAGVFAEKMSILYSSIENVKFGFWGKSQERGQQARIIDAIYLELPFLRTRKQKVAWLMKLGELRAPEAITQGQWQMMAEMLFGGLRRPQEYLSNLMLSIEHNRLPLASGLIGFFVHGLGERLLGIKRLGDVSLENIERHADPSWAVVPLAAGVAALGYVFPEAGFTKLALGLSVWPPYLQQLGQALTVGTSSIAALALGIGANVNIKSYIKETWLQDKYAYFGKRAGSTDAGKEEQRTSGKVALVAGLGGAVAAGLTALMLSPAMVAAGGGVLGAVGFWWGVNLGLKTLMKGINKEMERKNLIMNELAEVYWVNKQ